ncbi:ABC transporter [Pseudoclavibacter endophyticus]|uniref:ABC transporter n=1 Tax=Pseudoclavibacter endophyticus TaxID=1778590 RepID=A0A6H9WJ87_9MICO|nr:GTPase [Pseudoclavibacter endophyticus]KAB1646883.1 ABC transporter [Pseudoclavibacter endophyticus]GGA74730.1 ABC transporter [Pseudoclavibacter endophyticus]
MTERGATPTSPGAPGDVGAGGDALARLAALRDTLEQTRLPLQLADTEQARERQRALIRQIDDYLAPRLANLDAPLLAVVGGSTGAGKSTLVNSLVGHAVTRTGAIRPTTRQPILLHSPADAEWFASRRVLPGLGRITGTARRGPLPADRAGDDPDAALMSSVVLVGDERVPRHLAILDAPDVDSIADENRALAAQLLAAADLWLFVTTANRYADAVPWALLDDAAQRDITVGIVLDRVPPGAGTEIEPALRELLAERGLDRAPVFTIDESPLDELGMLPDEAVRGVRAWLADLAADRYERQRVARRTVRGAIARASAAARDIARARDAQRELAASVRSTTRHEYDEATAAIIDATKDGTLLRGEVLARWQDFVGTSDVFRSFESWFSRLRDRATAFVQGRPQPIREVEAEIEHGLHAVILDRAGRAAGAAYEHLRQSPAGRRLATDASLARESPALTTDASAMIRDWQAALIDLIREQSGGKRTQARLMSLGLNAVTVSLMVVLFASTGGLTGGELAIAGGSAVVGQKLLETIFGEEAVRRLAREARDDLERRVRDLLAGEYARYEQLLQLVDAGPAGDDLRDAADALERAMASVADAVTDTPDGAPADTVIARDEAAAEGVAVPVDVAASSAAPRTAVAPHGGPTLPDVGAPEDLGEVPVIAPIVVSPELDHGPIDRPLPPPGDASSPWPDARSHGPIDDERERDA